jgi:TM2 domain-containing membrane protein YozV
VETYEVELLKNMSQEQRMFFQSEFNSARKSSTTALLLGLFLGGFGAHHFYLGKVSRGILYALFFWTSIPVIVALIECPSIHSQVEQWNQKKAAEIAGQFKVLHVQPVGKEHVLRASSVLDGPVCENGRGMLVPKVG